MLHYNYCYDFDSAYKALAGGGSMGEHLFKISKHQLKSPTSTTKSEETVHHMLLGKRKKPEETSEGSSDNWNLWICLWNSPINQMYLSFTCDCAFELIFPFSTIHFQGKYIWGECWLVAVFNACMSQHVQTINFVCENKKTFLHEEFVLIGWLYYCMFACILQELRKKFTWPLYSFIWRAISWMSWWCTEENVMLK